MVWENTIEYLRKDLVEKQSCFVQVSFPKGSRIQKNYDQKLANSIINIIDMCDIGTKMITCIIKSYHKKFLINS